MVKKGLRDFGSSRQVYRNRQVRPMHVPAYREKQGVIYQRDMRFGICYRMNSCCLERQFLEGFDDFSFSLKFSSGVYYSTVRPSPAHHRGSVPKRRVILCYNR